MNTKDRNLNTHEMYRTSFALSYNVENLNNDDYKFLDKETQTSLIKIAEERARKLFGAKYARVEYKNLSYAVKYSLKDLIGEGDKVMVLNPKYGGYTEFSKLPYTFIEYSLEDSGKLNYKEIEELMVKEEPKVFIAGAKFTQFTENYILLNELCKKYGVLLVSIIGPSAGLTATGVTQNPVFWSDLVVVSLKGNLRGKEGAVILTNNHDYYLNLLTRNANYELLIYNTTVLKEDASPRFSIYGRKCLANAKSLASTFIKLHINATMTDNNIVVVKVNNAKEIKNRLKLKGYDATTFENDTLIFDTSYLSTLGYKPNDIQEFAIRIAETFN